MTYRKEEFRRWFAARGYQPNTVAAHITTLNRIDEMDEGLDERLGRLGTDGILAWAKKEDTGPFESYPSNARSALNRYLEFTVAAQLPAAVEDVEESSATAAPALFQLEREMQAAVRKQLHKLEAGLTEDDGGSEVVVSTGRIDIVARDKDRRLVAIELKAGLCPAGAIEQVLGYAEALSFERKEAVRAYLIAGEFSDRARAAAKRVRDLELRTYEFDLKFNTVTSWTN
jgi:hypothetical protein